MDSVFPRYPEIALLPRRTEILAVKEVIAHEKLHGSSFRVFFPNGMTDLSEVRFGSRETEDKDPNFPLGVVVQWWKSRTPLLKALWETLNTYGFGSDVTLFGEAYGPGIQAKGVKYTTGTEVLFRAFDIMVGANFLTYDLFCEVADKAGLPRVHEVWRGEPSVAAFDALLEKPSTEAIVNGITDEANLAEGVVIRSNPLLRNVFGEWLIVKHKGAKFSEVAHAPKAAKVRGETPADTFVQTYVTEGRVTNAMGRLADRGVVLKGSMADMPIILTEIVADLHKECEPEWKATGCEDKQLTGAVSKVLSPIYRALISV